MIQKLCLLLLTLIICIDSFEQTPPSAITISAITPVAVTISWNDVAGATAYNLQYKKSTDAGYITINTIAGHSKTLTSLSPSTSYVFSLQTVNAAGAGAFSSDFNFVTSSGANTTTVHTNAWVLNTNFTLPIVRFNLADKKSTNGNPKGNASFFNSLGAGISINWVKLSTLTDNTTNEVLDQGFTNIIGLQAGILFAANSSTGNKSNIFAPTISLTVLDIQFGMGYELGTTVDPDKRTFLTVSYGIPLSKITDVGTYIFSKKKSGSSEGHKSGFIKSFK